MASVSKTHLVPVFFEQSAGVILLKDGIYFRIDGTIPYKQGLHTGLLLPVARMSFNTSLALLLCPVARAKLRLRFPVNHFPARFDIGYFNSPNPGIVAVDTDGAAYFPTGYVFNEYGTRG